MIRFFVRHPVADYKAWREVFDAYHETRKQAGVVGEAVFQAVDDTNDVTLTLDFETLDAAKAFPENPKLKAALEKGGAIGAPTAWTTALCE